MTCPDTYPKSASSVWVVAVQATSGRSLEAAGLGSSSWGLPGSHGYWGCRRVNALEPWAPCRDRESGLAHRACHRVYEVTSGYLGHRSNPLSCSPRTEELPPFCGWSIATCSGCRSSDLHVVCRHTRRQVSLAVARYEAFSAQASHTGPLVSLQASSVHVLRGLVPPPAWLCRRSSF